MIYYRVEGLPPGGDRIEYYWETTQIKEKNRRQELKDKGYTGIKMDEMDVPTDKPSLTKWLQENLSGKD